MNCEVCKKRPAKIKRDFIDASNFCSKRCLFEYAVKSDNVYFEYCKKHNNWYFIINGSGSGECSKCRDGDL